MSKPDLLPSGLARNPTGRKFAQGLSWIRVHCINCGLAGPWVTEDTVDWAFWICHECEGKFGRIAGMMCLPDHVVRQKIEHEQVEKYGRVLTPGEQAVELEKGPDGFLARLVAEITRMKRALKEGRRRT